MQRIANRKKPKPRTGYYIIKHELFWSVGLTLLGAFFAAGLYMGSIKFDRDKMELSSENQELKLAAKQWTTKIEYMRRVSDSAHQILGHMPYHEMNLDSGSYRRVQSTIEKAGAALHLNSQVR